MGGVRMTHPLSGGEFDSPPSAVPFHQAAGWQVAPGQTEQGDVWPEELLPFEGQQLVWLTHPDLPGQDFQAAESAVPIHRANGWRLAEDEPEEKLEDDGLEVLTVEELKDEARARDLPVSGTKAELLQRLRSEGNDDGQAEAAGQTNEEE
jgi:hypothetical protein